MTNPETCASAADAADASGGRLGVGVLCALDFPMAKPRAQLWSLTPALKHYDWADGRFLADLLGAKATQPVAEAWFGAHAAGPAQASAQAVLGSLDAFVAEDPEGWLGPQGAGRFGALPYLLKLLAAGRPLSVQVHPDAAQAREGYRAEEAAGIPRDASERVYKDPNRKPELVVALTPFRALCGFRAFHDIGQQLERLPELASVLPPFEPGPEGLRQLLDAWFELPAPEVRRALSALLERLDRESPEPARSKADPAHWALFAHRTLGFDAPDRGLLFVFLLEIVDLAPGEGIYLDAGVPHAYLHGAGVEVMASSDNVLRAGLTRKHVSPAALLDVVRYVPGRPEILRPERAGHFRPGEWGYLTPVEEFALCRLELGARRFTGVTIGPETFLVADGEGAAEIRVQGDRLRLTRGHACILPHDTRYEIRGLEDAPLTVYRTSAPAARSGPFLRAIRQNIEATTHMARKGVAPALVGTVSGSVEAARFWQDEMERALSSLGAERALSLHEDLPVNQAFGLLLMWQRLQAHFEPGRGALMAFVFGSGSRAAPFTEAELGQKPAMASCTRTEDGRVVSIVELAMRYFIAVEAHLRRSGFDGVVVKWGDEVQIPTADLSGRNPLFEGADVVRFVSLSRIDEDNAANKDWVGVDDEGRVTAFIPRRPLSEMYELADRGLLQRREEDLYGGVNLGSVALSRNLMDVLLEAFEAEVNDPHADRKKRPDLDPQLFTALTIAAISEPHARAEAWRTAMAESAALRTLEANLPGVVERLRGALDSFEARHGRPVKMVAMNFGDQYWGDVGQHRKIHDFYLALRRPDSDGAIARALAGLDGELDGQGNLLVNARLGPDVDVQGSVLVDVAIMSGRIRGSVLMGTRAERVEAETAFDIFGAAPSLHLPARAGTYRVLSDAPIRLEPGERRTSVLLDDEILALSVQEDADLRDSTTYDLPVGKNPLGFREAHRRARQQDPQYVRQRREALRKELSGRLELPE